MKLSAWTILTIGFAFMLGTLTFALFQHAMPNWKERDMYVTLKQQYETEIAKRPRAIKRQEDAKKMVNEKAAQWREVVLAKTPPTSVEDGGINLAVNAWQLTADTRRFRNSMQRHFNRQVKRGGVIVINGPSVPEPTMEASSIMASYYNYPAVAFPVVTVDFGTVVVRGTYSQIMQNVRSWSTMPNYLVVADGLQLTGTSPNLTGTYNLSMVAYIRGKEIFPVVPEGGGAQGGGAPGGGGGGNQQITPNNPPAGGGGGNTQPARPGPPSAG